MPQATAKICTLCGQDVTQANRVKDSQGRYFCEPCYQQVRQTAPPAAAASAAAPAPATRGQRTAPPRAPAAGQPAKQATAPTELPARCPFCNTPVFTKSIYCVGCRRDMTQTAKIGKIIADAADTRHADQLAKWIARGVTVVAVLVIGFLVWFAAEGYIMQAIGPGDPFSNYPTSRRKLLDDFFADLSKGTPDAYDKAYVLMSFRERGPQHDEERMLINFRAIHEQWDKKYGPNWDSHLTITIPPPDQYLGDEVWAEVHLGKDTYHVQLEAQTSIQRAAADRLIPLSKKVPYREDGKMHWGIGELQEHPLGGVRTFAPGSDVASPGPRVL